MARTRNIKPSFFTNEVLADLQPVTRLLFIGLWCLADRAGRLEDRPKRIKALVLPFDDVSINDALNELQDCGFIVRYTAEDRKCIQILSFTKHQYPHKTERQSELPSINANLTEQVPLSNGYKTPVLPSTLPPFNPSTLSSATKVADGVDEVKRRNPKKPMPTIPPELDEPAFQTAWSEWLDYRRERKPAVNPRSAAMSLKMLAELGAERSICAIEFSIANGYQGIVEPRGQMGKKAVEDDPLNDDAKKRFLAKGTA